MGALSSRNQNNEKDANLTVSKLDDLTSRNQPKDNNNLVKLPEPKPPKTRKKDIFPDVASLKHIDDHVMKTPRYAEASVEKLGRYLVKLATNDIEKVRAFYKWVTENISYDTDSYFGKTSHTSNDPTSLLTSKTSVCEGYATIFQLLCEYAEIPVKKISGHAKGYSYKAGFSFTRETPTNHAWNAVYVNGSWRFIETTWGAGTVGNNRQFLKEFTDFYFLTDPDLFIVDHFPYFDNDDVQSSKWQLLKKPITLETYNKRIKPSRHAREWEVQFTSHRHTVIEIDKSVHIKFHTKSDILNDLNVKLLDSSGRSVEQYATVKKKQSRKFTVTVCPPSTGEYHLEKYGAVDSESTSLHCLVSYVIKCKSVENDVFPFPKFHSFYGPVDNWKERGFVNADKIPVRVTSKTGELSLPIAIKEGTNVMATLKNSDDIKLVQYTLLEMRKHLTLRARFPAKGYYRLIIYSQFQSERYTPAISILVHNLKVPDVAGPFPQTYPETIKFKCSLVEPLTRDLPANTEVRFRFSSPLMSEAMLLRETVPRNKNGWVTTIKTPPSGDLRISGKTDKDCSTWVVYSFSVKSS